MSNKPATRKSNTNKYPAAEIRWAMAAHLSALLGVIFPYFPFLLCLGPLVILWMEGSRSDYVRHHAKEALNFNISFAIYLGVSLLLCYLIVGIFLLPIIYMFWGIMLMLATYKASTGEDYTYRFAIRIIK